MSVDTQDDNFEVPGDFPKPVHLGAVGGAQPKFLAVMYQGRFYEPGATPPEVYERWLMCNDLAEQLVKKSLLSKAGKRAHMSETEILEQYFIRLLATNWTSNEEARWIINKVASELDWQICF
ncbi:hypothetical protein [Massilia sp. YIM B02443]|uniref:hypothetical protein n=1 Tax=Massilia sp. YIM B02443 TaxID=3050127 RepID=UPI0025B69240|nr:hypothetical protein [Massilia sp. YIM B02443]MDN4039298.1 hypothetical protein [Massilia sp. YIM B02443]